jgi:hypothetical protein
MRTPPHQSRPVGHRAALLIAMLATAALALAPAASADVGETIIQRCTHGQSLAGFSPRAYSRALKELSADAEEYTDCAALIRQAQLAAASHKAGAGGLAETAGAVAAIATPKEQRAIAHAAKAGAKPLSLEGRLVHPGVVHASVASALSTLPVPLLAMLALMLAGLLTAAGSGVRKRFRARRND